MVGPEKVIEKIKDGVNSKKLTGISDVVDLTDRTNGLRLVIEIKNGFNPEAVLAALYKHTPLEDSSVSTTWRSWTVSRRPSACST